MIAIVLTVVLFLKGGPVAITAVFEDPYACGAKETAIVNAAMKEQKVVGFEIISDCKRVRENNKV